MKYFIFFTIIRLFLLQEEFEIDWEFEDVEIYNFFLILFGIVLVIIILVYVLLSSKEE